MALAAEKHPSFLILVDACSFATSSRRQNLRDLQTRQQSQRLGRGDEVRRLSQGNGIRDRAASARGRPRMSLLDLEMT